MSPIELSWTAKKLYFGNGSLNQESLHILLVDNCLYLIPILSHDENVISLQVQCRGNRWQRRLEGGEDICSKRPIVHRSPLTSIQGIVIVKEALSHKEPKPRWFSRSKTALLIALSVWRR